MDTLDQVVFSGFTHEPAVELSEKLMEILPKNQSKTLFQMIMALRQLRSV